MLNCNLFHLQRQNGPIDFTLATNFHFLLPASLGRSLADCSIDEPAKISGSELPCGAILPSLHGATGASASRACPSWRLVFQSQNKEDLTFDMHRYIPPTLLKTLNGLRRNAQDLCHLALRFSQMSSNFCELLFLHPGLSPLWSSIVPQRDPLVPLTWRGPNMWNWDESFYV